MRNSSRRSKRRGNAAITEKHEIIRKSKRRTKTISGQSDAQDKKALSSKWLNILKTQKLQKELASFCDSEADTNSLGIKQPFFMIKHVEPPKKRNMRDIEADNSEDSSDSDILITRKSVTKNKKSINDAFYKSDSTSDMETNDIQNSKKKFSKKNISTIKSDSSKTSINNSENYSKYNSIKKAPKNEESFQHSKTSGKFQNKFKKKKEHKSSNSTNFSSISEVDGPSNCIEKLLRNTDRTKALVRIHEEPRINSVEKGTCLKKSKNLTVNKSLNSSNVTKTNIKNNLQTGEAKSKNALTNQVSEIQRSGTESSSSKEFQNTKICHTEYNKLKHLSNIDFDLLQKHGEDNLYNKEVSTFNNNICDIFEKLQELSTKFKSNIIALKQKFSMRKDFFLETPNYILKKTNNLVSEFNIDLDEQVKDMKQYCKNFEKFLEESTMSGNKLNAKSDLHSSSDDDNIFNLGKLSKPNSQHIQHKKYTVSDCDSDTIFSENENVRKLSLKETKSYKEKNLSNKNISHNDQDINRNDDNDETNKFPDRNVNKDNINLENKTIETEHETDQNNISEENQINEELSDKDVSKSAFEDALMNDLTADNTPNGSTNDLFDSSENDPITFDKSQEMIAVEKQYENKRNDEIIEKNNVDLEKMTGPLNTVDKLLKQETNSAQPVEFIQSSSSDSRRLVDIEFVEVNALDTKELENETKIQTDADCIADQDHADILTFPNEGKKTLEINTSMTYNNPDFSKSKGKLSTENFDVHRESNINIYEESRKGEKLLDIDKQTEIDNETTSSSETSDESPNSETEERSKEELLASDDSDISLILLESSSNEYSPSSDTASQDKLVEGKTIKEDTSHNKNSLLTTEEGNSNLRPKNCTSNESESDSEKINKFKQPFKRKILAFENSLSKTDLKLNMSCKVILERLPKSVLNQHLRALRKSKQHLDHKAIKRLIRLNSLEKKETKNLEQSTDSSDEEWFSSKRVKSLNKKKEKTKEKTVLDNLLEIENEEISEIPIADEDSLNTEINPIQISSSLMENNLNLELEEGMSFNKSDLNSEDNFSHDQLSKQKEEKKLIKSKNKNTAKKSDVEDESSDTNEEKKKESTWRRDKLLTMKFSDSDSDSEVEKSRVKKFKEKSETKNITEISSESDGGYKINKLRKRLKLKAKRMINSDSDVSDKFSAADISSETSDNREEESSDSKNKTGKKSKRKRNKEMSSESDTSSSTKKSKKKRRRIKKMKTDSDSESEDEKQPNSQNSPDKSGRKNIRKLIKDKQVTSDTKQAAKEEEERLKRIAERQKLYNEMYELRLAGEEKVEKLVLDFDTETKEPLVTVHESIIKHLKPHQAQGIKFMWDACFESLERIKVSSGSGCILAHCMGLGKSLQVVTLSHTLLSHENTGIRTIMVVCPLSTVLNWVHEFNHWLKDADNFNEIEIYELTKTKKLIERMYILKSWQRTGGVLVIGYEMFRSLINSGKNVRKKVKEAFLECLIEPGADLVVCDEGHLLKRDTTALSKCMQRIKTLRRIVLTGTPLQNNLLEYHCMVQFVKPNLLGTKNEFLNRFVNPITNGQFDNSTEYDVKLMKKRAHVLHKMLEGSVQRFDYSVLTPFLPPKQEYVIFLRLTDVQIKLYRHYLDNLARIRRGTRSLFVDFQELQRIWTHPFVLRLSAEKNEKANDKKDLSESEGSLKDFIDDGGDTSSDTTSTNSDVQAIDDENKSVVSKRSTRGNPNEEEIVENDTEGPKIEWWSQYVEPEHLEDMHMSTKLLLLFGIIQGCEQLGDKILVFSQSLYSLTLIEHFLRDIYDETRKDNVLERLAGHTGNWCLGRDYFRLDGQTSPENRSNWCKIFNKPSNTRARLFLISTRAGGLGINLTGANRAIIFDASWNPSHDVQSIFRIYRFGQKKPCYVYRFLAAGTMEEKIYNRQVTKLSLSCRVIDEQQIERHYSEISLNDLYTFDQYKDEGRPTLNLPKDRLLAEIFLKYKDHVENYHEHDSLLENKTEEELDEEERKQAWLEYEEEKKGKPANMVLFNQQQNMLMQPYNMHMVHQQSILAQQSIPNLENLLRKDYPGYTPEQIKYMMTAAALRMNSYAEQQTSGMNYNQLNTVLHNYARTGIDNLAINNPQNIQQIHNIHAFNNVQVINQQPNSSSLNQGSPMLSTLLATNTTETNKNNEVEVIELSETPTNNVSATPPQGPKLPSRNLQEE
ncbi:transcriptional regulator ATRX homolog isoform X2 [Prorops nasuta]|uniref:transcriptional regulator ATRX homolog isoform X2 n=1 Tax=Prorops nasuta TaxID=863751 RepID=UPI0034CFCA25